MVARLFLRTWGCPLRVGCTLYRRARGCRHFTFSFPFFFSCYT
ncbi:hypothetical protein BACUNI_01772 [Bacteroides uniformis ATCC 8492]|uniref:Uncharacterized protein n=1 Tax=Bacteroides uniformis (strain ATCC 8492 / DSM 6597 / CCUG 4942 / CIP 103695 / JCM 5828 / KCTC 5204 / NCTC 13054 / VPI 0061) TaxID=411479 RepID=A0ABC9NDG1_BACUC|nr:hypothetical protein BACUNI_01772 [Bacteroides uniformis ATCC 8492]